MEPRNDSYTPDEAALKTDLETLAQNIQPDPHFVAALEAQLLRQEAVASTAYLGRKTGFRYLALAAVLVLIPLVLLLIFAVLVPDDNGDTEGRVLTATPTSSRQETIFPTLEFDFSATAGPMIRGTATPAPTATVARTPDFSLAAKRVKQFWEEFTRWLRSGTILDAGCIFYGEKVCD
ncbi:MAG: hypothetical protein F9K27_05995 [Anaerolineae bacterium]|nr:MAG: hypothetical protein F9K27_05995 [Anaerolineae bacterium]